MIEEVVLRYCKVHEGGKRLECGKQLQAPHSGGGGKWGEKNQQPERSLLRDCRFFTYRWFSPHGLPILIAPRVLVWSKYDAHLRAHTPYFFKKDQVLPAIYLSSQNLYGEAGGTTNLLLLTSSHTQPTSCSFQGCPMPIQARLEMLQRVG